MVALGTGDVGNVRNTAMFGNLIINTVNGSVQQVTTFVQDANPPYGNAPVPTTVPGLKGDVNNSGTIDIVDALLVAQFYVGLISSFPC